MLIPSDRHSAADLELWDEHEAADLAHHVTMAGKAAAAIEEIKRFACDDFYCSTSWGKDSVVISHLCHVAGSKAPLGHLVITATSCPNPHSDQVAAAYLAMTGQECITATGRPHVQHDFAQLTRAVGTARHLNGVRAQESSDRKMSRKVSGKTTAKVCRPIIDWSEQDVFGYLAGHHLPVHPAYAMLGGGRYPRHHLRVSSLGGQRGGGLGRREWEAEYYPDVLARMKC